MQGEFLAFRWGFCESSRRPSLAFPYTDAYIIGRRNNLKNLREDCDLRTSVQIQKTDNPGGGEGRSEARTAPRAGIANHAQEQVSPRELCQAAQDTLAV